MWGTWRTSAEEPQGWLHIWKTRLEERLGKQGYVTWSPAKGTLASFFENKTLSISVPPAITNPFYPYQETTGSNRTMVELPSQHLWNRGDITGRSLLHFLFSLTITLPWLRCREASVLSCMIYWIQLLLYVVQRLTGSGTINDTRPWMPVVMMVYM